MASSWPGAIDIYTTNVDYVQYIEAALMNNVQNSIVALEGGIGAGTGTSPNNPLYSPVFDQTFATITARLVNVEEDSAGGLQLDHSAGDIQPLGTAAAAGSVGKAADSGHRHAGINTVASNITGAGSIKNGVAGSIGVVADAGHAHVLDLFGWSNPASGGTPSPGFLIQAGTNVITTGSGGGFGIDFSPTFPNGLLTVVAFVGGDSVVGATVTGVTGQASTSSWGGQVSLAGSPYPPGDDFLINWIAIGW